MGYWRERERENKDLKDLKWDNGNQEHSTEKLYFNDMGNPKD